jgi:hypothetical protein
MQILNTFGADMTSPLKSKGDMKICSNNIFGIEVAYQREDKCAGTIGLELA